MTKLEFLKSLLTRKKTKRTNKKKFIYIPISIYQNIDRDEKKPMRIKLNGFGLLKK